MGGRRRDDDDDKDSAVAHGGPLTPADIKQWHHETSTQGLSRQASLNGGGSLGSASFGLKRSARGGGRGRTGAGAGATRRHWRGRGRQRRRREGAS